MWTWWKIFSYWLGEKRPRHAGQTGPPLYKQGRGQAVLEIVHSSAGLLLPGLGAVLGAACARV